MFFQNIILSLLVSVSYTAEVYQPTLPYNSSPQTGKYGGVAADSKECSALGLEILKAGGNAVDSSITTTLCQGLIYPFASGIGGGGFMLVRLPNDSSYFINFREWAPKLANQTMFSTQESSLLGGLAVGVPGEIKGLELAHKQFGSLEWKQLIKPVISLARNGFKVTKQLAARIKLNEVNVRGLKGMNATYVNKDGSLVKEGQILKHLNLANTLEQIAQHGSKAFYEGKIAQSIVDTIQKDGGILSLQDLKDYKPEFIPAIKKQFMGFNMHLLPPPASGIISYHILSILKNIEKAQLNEANLLKFIEALKFGFVGRLQLGDPKFVDLKDTIKNILDDKLIEKEWKLINTLNMTKESNFYINNNNNGFKEDHGTSHVSVIDKNKLVVSVTSTINTDFGSKLLDLDTGILLNNQMDDFSNPNFNNFFGYPPSPSNFIRPFKRPQSSMTPLIFNKGNEHLFTLGASGGSRIISSVVHTVFHHLILNRQLNVAVDSPRLHNQVLPNQLRIEPNSLSNEFFNTLNKWNHSIVTIDSPESVVNAVSFKVSHKCNTNRIVAVTDARKDGLAAAY